MERVQRSIGSFDGLREILTRIPNFDQCLMNRAEFQVFKRPPLLHGGGATAMGLPGESGEVERLLER